MTMAKAMESIKKRFNSIHLPRIGSRNSGSNPRVNFGYQPNDVVELEPSALPDGRNHSVLEAVPSIDFYRNAMSVKKTNRPSLTDLHQEIRVKSVDEQLDKEKDEQKASANLATKFGWIVGVWVRCVLNILGAMLYLRLSWVSGQAGIGLATVIILLSSLVTSLTTLSMCAICTNGEIKGGGAYFMLSRALGPEFGGSMGLIFSLANALGVGMHIVGFSETVRDLIKENGAIIVDNSTNDVRVVGVCTLVICFCIVCMGIDFEVKAQLVLLVILIISYINYIIGTFIPPTLFKQTRGLTGYSWKTFSENFTPDFRGENFFTVFSVYFPAATGIMAGANISGDLKDPGSAIPKGTLLAILATTVTYLGGAWMSASCAIRDATGNMEDLLNGTISVCNQNGTGTCPYGIMNFFQTMEMQSGFGPLVTAGIFAATVSSALACLVSGPRLLQAVGRDKLFPGLEWFAKGYGKNDEPRRAYVLGFFISLGMVLVGDLNIIASYISNFYLATYALINYACFDGSIAKSPGWRPSFRYYNKWTALLGAILCTACMFLMSWIAALLTTTFIILLYIYLLRKQPDANWGSSNQAHNYREALKSALKLLNTEEHIKNYRPQILALTGNPISRPPMVDFVRCITGNISLLMFGHVILARPDSYSYKTVKQWSGKIYNWLKTRKAKGFYNPVAASSLREGLQALLQAGGIGKLKPNVVLIGFKNDWVSSSYQQIEDYFQLLHESFECGVGVIVLRVSRGLDYSSETLDFVGDEMENDLTVTSMDFIKSSIRKANNGGVVNGSLPFDTTLSIVSEESFISESPVEQISPTPIPGSKSINEFRFDMASSYRPQNSALNDFLLRSTSNMAPDKILRMNQFMLKVRKPTIDIWWLSDDGGLTLLIPYLLTHRRSYLARAKLRVFTPTTTNSTLSPEEQQKNLSALLKKFRIKASDVTVVRMDKAPQLGTVNDFERAIAPFKLGMADENKSTIESQVMISNNELVTFKDRTNFHLRTRDLLLEHSKNASLIVLTMPVPRKGSVSACLYLSWLDMLSKDFSPILFIRGNQQSVLTFYS